MSNFPGKMDEVGHSAFRAATEAVLGLLVQSKPVNAEAIHDWLEKSLDGNVNLIATAEHFTNRILTGPHHRDWPAGKR